MSHSPASVWKELISHTLRGDAINYTTDRLGLSHTTIFLIRHKFLLTLQYVITQDPVILKQVSELDETFVLKSLKGKQLPEGTEHTARKHGKKGAETRNLRRIYLY